MGKANFLWVLAWHMDQEAKRRALDLQARALGVEGIIPLAERLCRHTLHDFWSAADLLMDMAKAGSTRQELEALVAERSKQ